MWWPFLNGWMLLFGVAAAAPIIIHLWNKRKYHEVPWAAMRYLMAAMRKHQRRMQVEQWILLALRTLILLLLAMALANPVARLLPSLGGAATTGGQAYYVLVLDASYSMAYQETDESRFERAQQLATDLVRQSRQGDGFSLLLMGQPPQVIVGEVAFDPEDVIEEIQNLTPRHYGASLGASLAQVQQLIDDARQDHPRLSEVRVCFFTDLGRTTWEEVTTRDARAQLGKLSQLSSLVLIDVGDQAADNLAITRLAPRDSLVTVAEPVTIEADVQNFGTDEEGPTWLELLVDGQPVAEQEVARLDADGRAGVSFLHRFETPGEHVVQARLRKDRLLIDNVRWAAIPVRESIRVLCVRGAAGAAQPVALALAPLGGAGVIRPEVVSESAVLEVDLHQYDCVFLCNVGRFGRDEAIVLYQYVRSGGGLVFFLGDQVQPENYNQELASPESGQHLLPARLGAAVSEPQYGFSLDALDYRHPLVAPFRGYQRSGLLTTPIWKYFQLQPTADARVALALGNGDPAIVEQQIGRGRTILVATSASSSAIERGATGGQAWSDLAAWPSFVPLVQEMLALAISGRSSDRNLEVGDLLEGYLPPSAADVSVVVAGPQETAPTEGQRVAVVRREDMGHWSFLATPWSGVYKLHRESLDDWSAQLFAVNVDTRESDLTRFERELLPSQFAAEIGLTGDMDAVAPVSGQSDLFRILLGGVFGLLLLETLLAWRFGRSSS